MSGRRSIAAALAILAGVASLAGAVGCGDDDEGGAGEEAQAYALEVERISDDAYAASQDGLVALNEVADGSVVPDESIPRLEAASRTVSAAGEELAALTPPEQATATADDLEFALASASRGLDSAASAIRVAAEADLATVANLAASTVLAEQSGYSALSRALRRIAVGPEG